MAKSDESADRRARVLREMLDDIVFGAYAPGTRLKMADLQVRYSATLAEIRSVLAELRNLQLVDHLVNAGFRVAMPDEALRVQTAFVRTALEKSAVPFIAARATQDDIRELRQLAQTFEKSIDCPGRTTQAKANYDFHERIVAIAGNAVLAELVRQLRARHHYVTAGRWRTLAGLHDSSREHFRMVDAIEARDPAQLERIVDEHIRAF